MKLAVSPIHPGRCITACDRCGSRFLTWTSSDQRYCSRRCYNAARAEETRDRNTRACVRCGALYVAAGPSDPKRYCSPACFREARKEATWERNARACAQCGTLFADSPARSGPYCSQTCAGLALTAAGHEMRCCKKCGQDFRIKRSEPHQFCTRACYEEHRQATRGRYTCAWCKETYYRSPAHPGRYCSYDCANQGRTRSNEDRFWAMVDKTREDGCWLWTGTTADSGHGIFTIMPERKGTPASRYAWQLLRGAIPAGLLVCHNCPGGDNPACVNPEHMFLGTHDDHGADRARKGQAPRGEASGAAVLTEEGVRLIRTAPRKPGWATALAAQLGCSVETIHTVRRGHTWKHVVVNVPPDLPRTKARSLTEEEVQEIRAQPGARGLSRRLSAQYGVGVALIKDIRGGRAYADVPGPPAKRYEPLLCVCVTCGKEVACKQSAPQKFCSRACQYAGKHVERPCAYCGKMFRAKVSAGQEFCSKGCGYAGGRRHDQSGEKNASATLTEEDVLAIRRSSDAVAVLAARYRMSVTGIRHILSGKLWSHLDTTIAARPDGTKGDRHPHAKLTTEDVLAIRASDEPTALLAARYHVTTVTIGDIRRRTTWQHLP